MNEIWKQIDEFPNYQVSNLGRIRNITSSKILLGSKHNTGYIQVSLYHNKKLGVKFVHILVCTAFNGIRPFPEAMCLHRDDIRTNNYSDNVYWGTVKDNVKDMIRNERIMPKLDINGARAIRALVKAGVTHHKAAEQFGVSKSLVGNIVRDRIWKE